MRSKSLTLAVLIGLGAAVVAAFVHFSRHADAEQTAHVPPPPQATAVISPFGPSEPASSAHATPIRAAHITKPEPAAEQSGTDDADARAVALRELEVASADSLPLLEQTLRSDPAARNRLLAVKSVRLYGLQAGNAERARAALRLALSDADLNVRTNAQDAYDELAH